MRGGTTFRRIDYTAILVGYVGALLPIAGGALFARRQADQRNLEEAVECLIADAATFPFVVADQQETDDGPVRAEVVGMMRDIPRWTARCRILGGSDLAAAAREVGEAMRQVAGGYLGNVVQDRLPSMADEKRDTRLTEALHDLERAAREDPLLRRRWRRKH